MNSLTTGLTAFLFATLLVPVSTSPANQVAPQAPRLAQPPTPAEVPTPNPATFPASWIGHWKGDASSGNGVQSQQFTMELIIAPTDKPDRFGWTIVYSGAAGRQERAYTLIVKEAAKGLYSIDENNGIVLDARLMGGTLFSHFLIQGSRLTTRDRLEAAGTADEHISIEIVTTIEDQSSPTGGKDGVPEVQSWSPASIQIATLRRLAVAPKPADQNSHPDAVAKPK